MTQFPQVSWLNDAGLNRQHVFDLDALPADLLAPLQRQPHERQLILFAHGGRRLWERVQAEGGASAHPIDDYSRRMVRAWLAQALPQARFRFVYPGGLPPGQHLGLQRLGALAGWHHASPFMVGIDAEWGSWFAYRVALITDTALPPSIASDTGHPCQSCISKPCIKACPAKALDAGRMDAPACFEHRLQEDSSCALSCQARLACPVRAEHRYEESQIAHSAAGSRAAIRLWLQR